MANQPLLNPSLLSAALEGLEAQKARIDEQINQVRSLMGRRGPGRPRKDATSAVVSSGPDSPPAAAPKVRETGAKKSRKMSAAGRKRIAEAQKRRWDAFRAQKDEQQ